MGARPDILNRALLDQRRSIYRGTIQPGCEQRWRMCEQGVIRVLKFSQSF